MYASFVSGWFFVFTLREASISDFVTLHGTLSAVVSIELSLVFNLASHRMSLEERILRTIRAAHWLRIRMEHVRLQGQHSRLAVSKSLSPLVRCMVDTKDPSVSRRWACQEARMARCIRSGHGLIVHEQRHLSLDP